VSSGEHRISLEAADTEPCDAPSDPEILISTIPPAPRVPRLDLKTDAMDNGDEFT